MATSLRVFLLEPAANATWAVGKTYAFTIIVRAQSASAGTAQLQYDNDIFALVDSVPTVILQSLSEKTITWYVKLLKPASETALAALVTADQLAQAAMATIKVIA